MPIFGLYSSQNSGGYGHHEQQQHADKSDEAESTEDKPEPEDEAENTPDLMGDGGQNDQVDPEVSINLLEFSTDDVHDVTIENQSEKENPKKAYDDKRGPEGNVSTQLSVKNDPELIEYFLDNQGTASVERKSTKRSAHYDSKDHWPVELGYSSLKDSISSRGSRVPSLFSPCSSTDGIYILNTLADRTPCDVANPNPEIQLSTPQSGIGCFSPNTPREKGRREELMDMRYCDQAGNSLVLSSPQPPNNPEDDSGKIPEFPSREISEMGANYASLTPKTKKAHSSEIWDTEKEAFNENFSLANLTKNQSEFIERSSKNEQKILVGSTGQNKDQGDLIEDVFNEDFNNDDFDDPDLPGNNLPSKMLQGGNDEMKRKTGSLKLFEDVERDCLNDENSALLEDQLEILKANLDSGSKSKPIKTFDEFLAEKEQENDVEFEVKHKSCEAEKQLEHNLLKTPESSKNKQQIGNNNRDINNGFGTITKPRRASNSMRLENLDAQKADHSNSRTFDADKEIPVSTIEPDLTDSEIAVNKSENDRNIKQSEQEKGVEKVQEGENFPTGTYVKKKSMLKPPTTFNRKTSDRSVKDETNNGSSNNNNNDSSNFTIPHIPDNEGKNGASCGSSSTFVKKPKSILDKTESETKQDQFSVDKFETSIENLKSASMNSKSMDGAPHRAVAAKLDFGDQVENSEISILNMMDESGPFSSDLNR